MLVKFTCKAYPDITMFGDVAVSLLKMMGHSGTIPGALLAEDVPAALERLKQAIAAAQPEEGAPEEQDDEWKERRVSLAHRALPLVELLSAAAKAKADVMWSTPTRGELATP